MALHGVLSIVFTWTSVFTLCATIVSAALRLRWLAAGYAILTAFCAAMAFLP